MKKLIYLTTNPYKVKEANKFFKEKEILCGISVGENG